MKLGLDPRLPVPGSPDNERSMYQRLYAIFRLHAQAVNSNADAAEKAQSDAGSAAQDAQAAQQTADDAMTAVNDLLSAVPWLGTPIGGYITSYDAPPTNDARFRFILCSAGNTGTGQYNEGVLTNETVTGTAPLVNAIATVNLAGSPLNGLSLHLVNTEGRFVGAGAAPAFEDDSIQNFVGEFTFSTAAGGYGVVGLSGIVTGPFKRGATTQNTLSGQTGSGNTLAFDPSLVARTSDHTQPRAHRLVHYRRIL